MSRQQRLPIAPWYRTTAILGAAAMVVCGRGAPEPAEGPTPTLARVATQGAPAPSAAVRAPTPAFSPAMSRASTAPRVAVPQEAVFGTAASADSFAAMRAEPLPDNITYEGDTITWSGTLAGDQADADMSVRYYAPGNDAYVPQTVFDASSFNHLKIQLGSTTDALLAIKLQPNPVPADGCTATAFVLVDSSMTELVLDLDAATFSLPDHCTGGTDVVAVKSALHAIDIVNPATAAGDHDFRVGNATFGY